MTRPGAAALPLLVLIAACAPMEPEFPPGAVEHGPYLDRSFEGFVVRAVYQKDITVIAVQDAADADEPASETYAKARVLLGEGDVIGPSDLTPIDQEAPRFEAAAMEAAGIPGWCRTDTKFSYLPPIPTPLAHEFKIRGTYSEDMRAFVFAGQCR